MKKRVINQSEAARAKRKLYSKTYYQNNKQRIREKEKERRKNGLGNGKARDEKRRAKNKMLAESDNFFWAKRRMVQKRSSAKREGIECSVSDEYISSLFPSNGLCPVLGIKLEKFGRPSQDNLATIDRIDNDIGYVEGNVAIISHRANAIKRDASITELELVLDYARGRGFT